ncbi:MAG: hypothetical protein NTZ16_10660 [Verrucomicrobia bacterium]|nr:hypothetical protein [Verrucomicrobiota bacterium]
MRLFTHCFQRVHLYVLMGFVIAFSALTFWFLVHQSANDWRENKNYTATLLTISGPFTGAIARPSEAGCLRFAWKLFPSCAAVLFLGVICQLIPFPFQRGSQRLRVSMWIVGLLGWFAGSVLSLLFALG